MWNKQSVVHRMNPSFFVDCVSNQTGLALYGRGQRQCLFIVCLNFSIKENQLDVCNLEKQHGVQESEFCHFGIVLLGEVKWQLTEGVMLFLQTWVNN